MTPRTQSDKVSGHFVLAHDVESSRLGMDDDLMKGDEYEQGPLIQASEHLGVTA